MAQANSVYITPPTNTSAIDHTMMFPPREDSATRLLKGFAASIANVMAVLS
jgi:hypothetical protein